MKDYPAIAVLEFGSIADGIYSTDAMLKKAPIAMIKSGTVSGGRYLIILGGSTASVRRRTARPRSNCSRCCCA